MVFEVWDLGLALLPPTECVRKHFEQQHLRTLNPNP